MMATRTLNTAALSTASLARLSKVNSTTSLLAFCMANGMTEFRKRSIGRSQAIVRLLTYSIIATTVLNMQGRCDVQDRTEGRLRFGIRERDMGTWRGSHGRGHIH